MKKNILFILHVPPPINGAAIVGQLIQDSNVLKDTFESDFINLTTSFSLDKIGKNSKGKILTVLKIQYQIIRALTLKRYAICYMTLSAKGAGFYKDMLIVLILKMFRQKIIYHFHNKGVKGNSGHIFNRLLYRFAFKNTQSILLSQELYADIDCYVKEANVYFCSNGIPDIKNALSVPRKLEEKAKPVQLLFLSNMMLEKGVFDLLGACRILKEKRLSFECHFVGAWSDISKPVFFQKVEELEITKHIFAHGKKYGEDKNHFFTKTDVFILPSSNDCFPLVLLEAMQYSIPTISTLEGGIPTLVTDKKTGILIPPKNIVKLADSIQFLIENPEIRTNMGIAGRQRYENLFTVVKFEKNRQTILEKAALKNQI